MERLLAAAATVIGVRYASFGVTTLFYLSQVTHAWIDAARDRDFRHDFAAFRVLGGGVALLVTMLGVVSVVYGIAMILERKRPRRRWMALTILALAVHTVRVPIELVAGTLQWWSIGWFAAVCGLYAMLWLVDEQSAPERRVAGTGAARP